MKSTQLMLANLSEQFLKDESLQITTENIVVLVTNPLPKNGNIF